MNSASHYPVASSPNSDFAPSVSQLTHTCERFLLAVESEVARFTPVTSCLRTFLLQLAMTLQMNGLEIVAWNQLLRRALYAEPRHLHTSSLLFSAYLAKSLLSRGIAADIDAQLAKQYPNFEEKYEMWLKKHQRCTDLVIPDLHFQFKHMWTLGTAGAQTTRLDSVVERLIYAPKPAYPLTRSRTLDFKFGRLTGSSISTEASWSA